MSRLSIEITPEEHQQIKAMAALQGKSIKDLVMERLFSKTSQMDADWMEFATLLKNRIKKAEDSEPIVSSFSDIAKEQLATLEKLK
ncbi:UNVERIFIED_CONTAM: hypothetical protein GTU68_052252 [Idotea baltica]|nr:hypothetical protein [Idotea baltica]